MERAESTYCAECPGTFGKRGGIFVLLEVFVMHTEEQLSYGTFGTFGNFFFQKKK